VLRVGPFYGSFRLTKSILMSYVSVKINYDLNSVFTLNNKLDVLE
jgi:hypothetical protein